MASFVAEVLSSAGQMEREEINEKLSMLGRRMEELKLEIHGATTASAATFTEFEPSFDITVMLADKVRAIREEMDELSHKVETEAKGQLKISTGEFQCLTRQQELVTKVMGLLEKMTKAQQLMETIATATSQGKYSEASSCLVLLEEALRQPACEREEEIKSMVSVVVKVEVLKQKLIHDINKAWEKTVFWTSLDGPSAAGEAGKKEEETKTKTKGVSPQGEDRRQWELRLPKSDSTAEQQSLTEMVTALSELGQLNRKVQLLGRHLVQNIFPLTLYWQKVVVTETPLAIGKKVVIKAQKERRLPHCVDVFSVVGGLLDLLNDSLLHVQLPQGGKGEEGTTVTLMNLLGEEIGEKILDGLVKECLSQAIPSSQQQLQTFHEVVAVTRTFQERLVALGFVAHDSRTLLDYVQNVNVLFANKKCQSILERARGLMTSDIHDTALISSDASPGELPPLDKSGGPSKEKSRKMEMAGDPLLSDSTFRMPTCRISVCVQELLELAYATLDEATSSAPQCAVQMFYAVRNIFELFCSVFPTYHAHSLANFPQLTALHHNNCMFLAHHLQTLGPQFKHSLPSNVSATFLDLVPEIRTLGTSSFLEQMNMQKAILEQYVDGAAGFASMDEESNYESAEKSLKQALHQLTHLQKVWQDVLPATVYRKAVGLLLNSLLVHVMDRVTCLEDISSEAGRKLFLLLKMVDDRAATLFLLHHQGEPAAEGSAKGKAKVDLHRHVSKYAKFAEVQLVLNGSLQEIADRWAEGMGPLAAELPPSELKQLIRALFQNTDRRAAVLAKIK